VGTKEETVKMASRFFMVPIEILLEMKCTYDSYGEIISNYVVQPLLSLLLQPSRVNWGVDDSSGGQPLTQWSWILE